MAVLCSLCGTSPDPDVEGYPPLGWSSERDLDTRTGEGAGTGARTRWVCGTCTRRHVRSIEAKLEQEWW